MNERVRAKSMYKKEGEMMLMKLKRGEKPLKRRRE